MNIFFQKYKKIIIGLIVAIVAIILFINKNNVTHTETEADVALFAEQTEPLLHEQEKESEYDSHTIFIDIKGAVKMPGLYEAKEGERIYDLIERAGGLLDEADEKQVNFAQRVSDEMIVYIPMEGEELDLQFVPESSTGQSQEKVNINRADQTELEALPGIGPAKAQAIIDYRKQNGPFQQNEDLKNVSGIGEKTFEKLQDSITVN